VIIEIVYFGHGGSRQVEHIGSAHDDMEPELLKAVPWQRLVAGQGVRDLGRIDVAPDDVLTVRPYGTRPR
jgi:hypothetical protein